LLTSKHRLQECKHFRRRLLGSIVADHVSKFFEPSVYRAHVTAQIVHQDFRRIGPTVHKLTHVRLVIIPAHIVVFAHQNGHDPDLVGIHLTALEHGPIQYF
jgi:hypothetical protein